MRILLVEDNPELAGLLLRALAADGDAVDWLEDGSDAGSLLNRGQYALVILDLSLPGMDGMTVPRRLRQREQSIPVRILTARAELSDRVEGLHRGADDAA